MRIEILLLRVLEARKTKTKLLASSNSLPSVFSHGRRQKGKKKMNVVSTWKKRVNPLL
jgi:hypothetical protein